MSPRIRALLAALACAAIALGACKSIDIHENVGPCTPDTCADAAVASDVAPPGQEPGGDASAAADAGTDACDGNCSGDVAWAVAIGSAATDSISAFAVDKPTSSIFVAGTAGGPITLDADAGTISGGAFVLKLDANGAPVWYRRIGGNAGSLKVVGDGAGGVFVAFSVGINNSLRITWGTDVVFDPYRAGIVVLHASPSGDRLWHESIPYANTPAAMSLALDGNLQLAFNTGPATSYRSRPIEPGSAVIKIAKATGDPLFVYQPTVEWPDGTRSGTISARSLAVDSTGRSVFGGSFQGSVSFNDGGSYETSASNSGFAVSVGTTGSGGSSAVYRYTRATDGGFGDTYVTSASSSGADFSLAGRFEGSASLNNVTVSVGDGGPWIPGVFLAKTDPSSLRTLAARAFIADSTPHIADESTGNVVIAGSFSGTIDPGGGPMTSAGATDVYVAKYDATLKTLAYAKRFGGLEVDGVGGLAILDKSDDAIVAGNFAGWVDFGQKRLSSQAASRDIFVVRLLH